DPEPVAYEIRDLRTQDGGVLLFNLHISSSNSQPVAFPDRDDMLADESARRLFRMSSILPPQFVAAARENRINLSERSRGFVFNADLEWVIHFLDIGTRVDKNLR